MIDTFGGLVLMVWKGEMKYEQWSNPGADAVLWSDVLRKSKSTTDKDMRLEEGLGDWKEEVGNKKTLSLSHGR